MEKRDLMKQVRMSIVGILGCIALILMVGEPIEEETWFRVFFITKGLAFLIGYVCYALFVRWESKALKRMISHNTTQCQNTIQSITKRNLRYCRIPHNSKNLS